MLLETKPQGKNPELIIKVIDFGTSCLFEPAQKLNAKYGTAYYIAPEVLARDYDQRCDIWSAGVILYILLCGYPPFTGKTDDEILDRIKQGEYTFAPNDWANVSEEAKALIRKILVPQDKRPQAADVLNDPWIQKNAKSQVVNTDQGLQSLQNLKNFRAERKLQQAVLAFITNQLISTADTRELRDNFKQFDKNGDGKLSKEELIEGFATTMGEAAAVEQVNQVMAKVDMDKSGFLDYSEFIAAAMDLRKSLSKQNLEAAFKMFDTDNSGSITVSEIQAVMGNMSSEGDEQFQKVLKEVDQDGNGEIDLKEFKELMLRLL